MIQVGTQLKVSDNSGARYVTCIKVLNGYKRRYAKIGDKIAISVKSLRSKRRSYSKIQKGKVGYGVIIRLKARTLKGSGVIHKFSDNAIVLVTKQGKPLGTRVIGGISREVRFTKYMRLVSLSAGLIK